MGGYSDEESQHQDEKGMLIESIRAAGWSCVGLLVVILLMLLVREHREDCDSNGAVQRFLQKRKISQAVVEGMDSFVSEFANAVPEIDEALSCAEKLEKVLSFDIVEPSNRIGAETARVLAIHEVQVFIAVRNITEHILQSML
ncbi:hypothetical protein C5167_043844 [Papaver somniferum]|uniref:Uncharacterized protein n=1 Tax=Papaver somniferum TaxID=3469 RepID=A0A4Y7L9D0_PAPSO|nr:hypothetical protein C5167_043844 [Papaver somniferum]